MPRERRDLTTKDCQDVLSTDITIGQKILKDKSILRFAFNPWDNEYVIKRRKRPNDEWTYVDGGQAIEELLFDYNETT